MTMHFPAHESLQEFAARTKRSVAAAYDDWHNRPYPAFATTRVIDGGNGRVVADYVAYEYRGPGLGIRR